MRRLCLILSIAAVLVGCGSDFGLGPDSTEPHVQLVEKGELVIGESLHFYGSNFLSGQEGKTKLIFEGFYWYTDGTGQLVSAKVAPTTIAPIYDGSFPEGTVLNGQPLETIDLLDETVGSIVSSGSLDAVMAAAALGGDGLFFQHPVRRRG